MEDDTKQTQAPTEAQPELTPAAEPTLTLAQVQALVAKSVKEALAAQAELMKPKEEAKELSRLAQLEASNKQMKDEREAEKAAARDSKLRESVKEQLASMNVPASAHKGALALLLTEKLITIDEAGTVSFVSDTYGPMKLGDGLKDWLKTEDAKAFLPPKGAQGSGDKKYAKPSHDPNPRMTLQEAGEALVSLIR